MVVMAGGISLQGYLVMAIANYTVLVYVMGETCLAAFGVCTLWRRRYVTQNHTIGSDACEGVRCSHMCCCALFICTRALDEPD